MRSQVRRGAYVCALTLAPEEAEEFDRCVVGVAEPVRNSSVEFGGFSGGEHQVLLAKDESEFAAEHVKPVIALVRPRVRRTWPSAGRQHILVRLHPSGTARQRDERHPVPLDRAQVDARISGFGRTDQLIQLDPVDPGQRQEQLERRPALSGFEAGEGADGDVCGRRQRCQRGVALLPQRAEPGSDRGQDAVQVILHGPIACHSSKFSCSFRGTPCIVVTMTHSHHHSHGNPFDVADLSDLYAKDFWDDRYASAESIWSGNPNPQLVDQVRDLTPGTALDIGSGEGADVIWLAAQGWTVTGVDVSQVALDRAAKHAAEQGIDTEQRITWQQVDLVTWTPTPAGFDLVSAQFMHLPQLLLKAVHARLAAAVRPGGSLLIVGHHPSDLDAVVDLSEEQRDFFYTPEQIAETLPSQDWEIVVADSPTREAKGPEGELMTRRDAVLHARRRPPE